MDEGLLPMLEYTDEFDDPDASAAKWTFRHEVEGDPAQFSSFTLGSSTSERAIVVPTAGGWFDGTSGPFVYQTIGGNFIMEAYVEAHHPLDPNAPPTQDYNSAGLLIRDPSSTGGAHHWVLQHLGMHDPTSTGVGIERKFTIASQSELDTFPGEFRGRIRLCKLGSTVLLTRMLIDEDEFTITGEYTMDVDPVQAGMSLTVWNTSTITPNLELDGDVVGEWDYVRFWKIDDLAQCLHDVPHEIEPPLGKDP